MRILLVTAYFPPEVGSASHLYYELATALIDLGHEVTVLTAIPGYNVAGNNGKYRRKLWVRESVGGINVLRIATPRLPRRMMAGRAIWQFGTAFAMMIAASVMRSHDAAIVYSPPLPIGLAAWAIKPIKNTKFVLNVQDLFPQSVIDLGLLRSHKLISVFEKLESFLYRKADAITVHSQLNADHVVSNGAQVSTTTVLQNWVNTKEIVPDGDGSQFRKRHELGDSFVVSFGGVLAYSQDLDMVLDAAKSLDSEPDIKWLIVGDGVERERLVSRASEMGLANVKFIPMLSREEYPELLYASDVCLATLKPEVKTPVVPSKIMSIMAAAKPVVAAMDLAGDAPRLIRDADCGFALPPADAEALARTIVELKADAANCRRLGLNGRTYAEAHLSIEAAASQYSAILADLCEKPESQVRGHAANSRNQF